MVLILLFLSIEGCGKKSSSADNSEETILPDPWNNLIQKIDIDKINTHMVALNNIATENLNRASGTIGYQKSIDYVKSQIPESFELFEQTFQYKTKKISNSSKITLKINHKKYEINSDQINLKTLVNPVTINDHDLEFSNEIPFPTGCNTFDYKGFLNELDDFFYAREGGCSLSQKMTIAKQNGINLIIHLVENFEKNNHFDINKDELLYQIQVIEIRKSLLQYLLNNRSPKDKIVAKIDIEVQTVSTETTNLIVTSKEPEGGKIIMMGGHLDSVEEGAGINDNGSGISALLELMKLQDSESINNSHKVSFSFWGAEEAGLIGSTYYVDNLSKDEKSNIISYTNFDMIASKNYIRNIYEGNDLVKNSLKYYFDKNSLPYSFIEVGRRSDHYPFSAVGIATSGLFTGASSIKSTAGAKLYGGTAGEAYDPCYHKSCDTIDNVNLEILKEMVQSMAHSLAILSISD